MIEIRHAAKDYWDVVIKINNTTHALGFHNETELNNFIEEILNDLDNIHGYDLREKIMDMFEAPGL